jgi:hypothetical protein
MKHGIVPVPHASCPAWAPSDGRGPQQRGSRPPHGAAQAEPGGVERFVAQGLGALHGGELEKLTVEAAIEV